VPDLLLAAFLVAPPDEVQAISGLADRHGVWKGLLLVEIATWLI